MGDGTTRTYSSETLYSPFGGLTKEKFGTEPTPLYNKLFYNARGQLAEIRESTSYTGATDTTWNRGAIVNHYSNNCSGMCGGSNSTTAMTDNNGNLKKQEVYVPLNDQIPTTSSTMWTDQFSYDALNRLQWIAEDSSLRQEYVYDRYGNRTIQQDGTKTYGTGINKKDFTVNTANNRLGVPSGQTGTMTYDAAGNLTTDTYSGSAVTRVYDAENRMTTETQANNFAAGTYTYNADGQRVRRTVGGQPSAVTIWQVYGFDGELLAEYAQNGAATSPQKEYGYRNGQLLITADAGAGLNGYANQRTITIDHTKVPNSDQSNFPMLISGTYSYLATTANGGNVQNANGYDVIFTSDAGCATKLNHEVESYNASTGAVNYWVKVPTVSHTTDTTIYMCYGNASITTDQSNKTGVWDANYKAVYHLPNGTTLSAADSTSNANNGSINGATATTGTIGGGAAGNASSQNLTIPNHSSVNPTANLSVACWVKTSQKQIFLGVVDKFNAVGFNAGYLLDFKAADGKPRFTIGKNGTYSEIVATVDIANGVWHQVVGTYDGSNLRLYIDGVLNNTVAASGNVYTDTNPIALFGDGSSTNYLNGSLDELRVSLSTRSADWVAAEYNNQNSPATFYSISSTSTGPAADIRWLVSDQLGTPRMIFDKTGSLANTKRHDYLPFGEELFAGQGARTIGLGFSGDAARQKFTQKERDVETGLDYFSARYYGSTMGRFVSVDPLGASAIVSDPQTFNHYTYTLNNPLKYVDPDGLDAQNPWRDLDDETKKLLASKLTTVADPTKLTEKELNAAGKAFDALVQVSKDGKLDVEATNTKIGTMQNFVDSLGHDSQVWDQVKSVNQVNLQGNGRQGDVEFTVSSRSAFENALTNTKDSNGYYRFTNVANNEAYRERGYSVNDPSMHISRDPRRRGGGYAHWDPSTAFTKATPGNVALDVGLFVVNPALPAARHLGGAMRHEFLPRPSIEEVRTSLGTQGLVPRH